MLRTSATFLVVLASCSPQPAIRVAPPAAEVSLAPTLYVDERASSGGDGSAERPFRTVQEALLQRAAQGVVVEINSGLYKGPFEVTNGVTLKGRGGAVVLHSDADVTVMASGGALERIIVQGGQVGLQVSGAVRLNRVELSGQRRVAIDVVGGALEGVDVKLEASVSETVGLSLKPNARAKLVSSRWMGPFRRGIEQHDGLLALDGARFDESVIAVHSRAGTASMSGVRVRDGREAGFLIGTARVSLKNSSVIGHEYGVLVGAGGELELNDFDVRRSERAGVALSGAKATIDGLRVDEGGSYAAVQLTQSTVTMKNVHIMRAAVAGVLINGGDVSISHTMVDRSRDTDGSGGDGIIARTGTVQLSAVQIARTEGAGVLSGNSAEVTATGVTIIDARRGGLVADFKGKLNATRVIATNVREAAFVAIEGATMRVDGAQVESAPDGLAWVDCASGSTLVLRNIKSAVAAPPSACIDVGP